MKWIKLFESFQSDALEDAKDILRLHLGEISQIREILHDWILQEYGLDLEPKKW